MLTVLSAGYPFAPVGPDAVGGAEQILYALDGAIVDAGFRSIVAAPAGSCVRGELCPTRLPDGALTDEIMRAQRLAFGDALVDCVRRERPDLIHLHGVDAAEYLPGQVGVPIVLTLHLWPDAYPSRLFQAWRSDVHIVCVSEAQKAACPPDRPYQVIRNGIDLKSYVPRRERQRAVLMLGRICPEKGFHLAIDAAQDAELPVILAGSIFPYAAHQHYFESTIAPRLNDRVTFVGPLRGVAKRRLLGSVSCVAVPTTVKETSSLVAMEALASGTPVVAFQTPALAELIEHRRTGFLVRDAEEMRNAFGLVESLSWQDCRQMAEIHCAAEDMTARYLRLYEQLAVPRTTVAVRQSEPAVAPSSASSPLS